jgi:hypothetical protein
MRSSFFCMVESLWPSLPHQNFVVPDFRVCPTQEVDYFFCEIESLAQRNPPHRSLGIGARLAGDGARTI